MAGFALALLLPAAHALVPALSPKQSLLGLFRERRDGVLACPVSLAPLNMSTTVYGGVARVEYRCSEFGTRYGERLGGAFVDLTPADDGAQPPWWSPARSRAERVQTDLFRLPTISFAYERGWRQNFERAGFPGIDAEFDEVAQFFDESRAPPPLALADADDDGASAPAASAAPAPGGAADDETVVLDLSCGSGLMSRRLARSGRYSRVIAADFSESMLLEARRRFAAGSEVGARGAEGALERSAWPQLVRADAARLPVATGALAGVHAGAAMHCWPRLEEALREVWRSLEPGGRFYATTFLYSDLLPAGAASASRSGNGFRVFELDELRELLVTAGFEPDAVDVRKEGRGCAIIKCVKASG